MSRVDAEASKEAARGLVERVEAKDEARVAGEERVDLEETAVDSVALVV